MQFKGKKICCSIDFSEHSSQVIQYSIALCKALNAELIVFHAIPFFNQNESEDRRMTPVKNKDQVYQSVMEKIEKLMENSMIRWQASVSFGDPVNEAARVISETGAELLTAVSYVLTGMKRLVLGSLIERLARNISCPLIVIPPKYRSNESFRLEKIVAGCDLSTEMSPLFDFTFQFAEKVNAELHLIHAVLSPAANYAAEILEQSYEQAQERMKIDIEQQLMNAVSSVNIKSVRLQLAVVQGVPGEAIAEYSKKHTADLIIVGVRYHKLLDKLLIGASTEFLLRHLVCPVLVYPGKV